MASSIGPLKCFSGACGHSPSHSSLANVVFNLGEDELPEYGETKAMPFGAPFDTSAPRSSSDSCCRKKSSRSSFDLLSLLYEHHGQLFNRQRLIPSVLQWRLLLDFHIDLGEKLVSPVLGAVASPRDPHRHWYGHGLRRWILVLQSYFSTHLDIAAGLTSAGGSVG